MFKLWIQRKGDVAELFSAALETTPTRALRNREASAAHAKNIWIQYILPKEHRLFFIEAHWTKSQHTKFRSQAKMKNCNIYPSYSVIKADKEERYPSKGTIFI